jgi:phosphoesterase RecJ-like protein
MIGKFKSLLSCYDKVTLLTHKNPDADTLGTALGIYEILKNNGKQVEVCNASGNLPNYLDFLPHFAKIKNRIDFDNSLIISCDAGSIDLLEFDLTSREIVNIDHHKSNTNYGILNIVDTNAASASQVAYMFLKDIFKINQKSATCFYVALVTDTQNFITLNVNHDVFIMASELISYGINLQEVNHNLTQRKSLSSLRILSSTLETLEFFEDASVASMVVTKERLEQTGASYVDLVGLVDYAIALATVKIAIVLIEIQGSIKVSMRSDHVDITDLAIHFGGGGHTLAAGFKVEKMCSKVLLNKINEEIKKRGLLNEL